MTKLRVVKERKQENNDEKDLRGLSELKSLNDAHPIAHLTISIGKSNIADALLSHMEKINFIDIQVVKSENEIHFSLKSYKNQSVKEQTVSLFVLSLIISNSFSNLKQSLWVSDKFKFHYSNELSGNLESEYSPNCVFKNSFFSGEGQIQLNGHTLQYLQQSGFNMVKNILSHSEMESIRVKELSNISAPINIKTSKAG